MAAPWVRLVRARRLGRRCAAMPVVRAKKRRKLCAVPLGVANNDFTAEGGTGPAGGLIMAPWKRPQSGSGYSSIVHGKGRWGRSCTDPWRRHDVRVSDQASAAAQ